MFKSLFRIGLTAALFGLLFVPGVSLAQDKRIRQVQDDAKLFSKDAIASANVLITKIKEKHKKDLLIETVAEGPDKDFNAWANQRFNNAAVDGVYVVLVKKPKKYHIDVGDQTLSKGYFTVRADIKELESIIKKKGGDKDLLNAIATFTLETMNERHKPAKVVQPAPRERPVPAERPAPAPVVHNERENTMPPWVGWVCMIVAILFVVWVVFAIIRALTNMGGGGGGYGYGGGGYGGGGGGGFFTGMLGGMFGAMAGMWIYNSMFGCDAAYRNDGSVDWGGGGGGASGGGETYQGDSDVGASAGGDADGGDWGGGGGGGDAGGGDAGGGGGGDWGGGGGDEGGGGGGDWGGGGGDGGGGDWGGGGGGGDFGGGGGGGDW